MATEPQTTFHASHFTLHEMRAQILLFMQNKAKLLAARMNITSVLTKHYENKRPSGYGENKANTNPIQTQYKPKTKPIKPNQSQLFLYMYQEFFKPTCAFGAKTCASDAKN